MSGPVHTGLAVFAVTLTASTAAAVYPLPQAELDEFIVRMSCHDACYDAGGVPGGCIAALCQPLQEHWDRNGDATVNHQDLLLATLETADAGALVDICYDDPVAKTVVTPALICNSPCLADPTLTTCTAFDGATTLTDCCQDTDGDGYDGWTESGMGTSSTAANVGAACGGNRDCGFTRECQQYDALGDRLCTDRTCVDTASCTAFHLEVVEENAQELLARVVYDYSPYPATILDLKIVYDRSALQLAGARPLEPLTTAGKDLTVTSTADGALRLIVMGVDSSPIVPGAIVELHFLRISPITTQVSFRVGSTSADDDDQVHSLAPHHGLVQDELANDALWGTQLTLADVSASTGDRILLQYDFENPAEPLAYADVPSAAQLCEVYSGCSIAGAGIDAGVLTRLEILQRGLLVGGQGIDGADGRGLFLNGSSDHLRLPLALRTVPTLDRPATPAEQSFTVQFWFYAEGYTVNEDPLKPQLLYSQLTSAEAVQLAVYLLPTVGAPGTFDLVFNEGLYDPATAIPIAGAGSTVPAVPWRTWQQLALSLDASVEAAGAKARAKAYLNGELVFAGDLTKTPAVACPQLGASRSNLLTPTLLGSATGASRPDYLYHAVAHNNFFGIERLDLQSFASTELLREPGVNARDPDYHPTLDKLVYASDATGSYEIWIANGDGTDRRAVTVGFGDASRGLEARRPRWSPNGNAIVFESDIYTAADNNLDRFGNGRVTHLYLVPFDPTERVVAVPTAGGTTITQLDYLSAVGSGRIHLSRLTQNPSVHHTHPIMLAHSSTETSLLFTQASRDYVIKTPSRLVVNTTSGSVSAVAPFGYSLGDYSRAGHDALLVGEPVADLFTATTAQFSLSVSVDAVTGAETVTLEPAVGAPVFSTENLLIFYHADAVTPDYTTFQDLQSAALEPKCTTTAASRQVGREVYAGLHVSCSPGATAQPYASITFQPLPVEAENEYGIREVVGPQLYTVANADTPTPGPPVLIGGVAFFADLVREAVFRELDVGRQVVVTGVKNARPVLFGLPVTSGAFDPAGVERLTVSAQHLEGLRWRKNDAYAACSWLGAYRQPTTGRIEQALRGGLDELAVYSYPRSAVAIRSEFIRGYEKLERDGRGGILSATLLECASDFDCGPFHLCKASAADPTRSFCTVEFCDPTAPTCSIGLCALLPETIEHEQPNPHAGAGGTWACTVECATDNACFAQECTNGPCRYCDADPADPAATYTCGECTSETVTDGALEYDTILGCPDSLRWSCIAGSCASDCYVEEDETYLYVCDPMTEACRQGRCEWLHWDWPDFAPATFSGVANEGAAYRAIPELYPVEVQAFGNGDYLNVPEILVEGQTTTKPWFEVGRIAVHNRSYQQARQNPYTVLTDEVLTDLRLRLHIPWSQNIARARCEKLLQPDCHLEAPSSASQLGYRVEISHYEVLAACEATGFFDCISEPGGFHRWLQNPAQAVVVTEISVNGTSVAWGAVTNTICPYFSGTALTSDPAGRMIHGGSLQAEGSNATAALFAPGALCDPTNATRPPVCTAVPKSFDLDTAANAYGVLNCDYAGAFTAGLAMPVASIRPPWSNGVEVFGNITENQNGCTVELARGSSVVTEACYEFLSDPAIDPLSTPGELHNSYEYTGFRSFAYTTTP